MSSKHQQQPIVRTVGRRQSRDGQEMEADRLRWTVDAVVARQLSLAAGAVLNTSGGVDMPSEEFLDLDETG